MKINTREISCYLSSLACFYQAQALTASAMDLDDLSSQMEKKADEIRELSIVLHNAKMTIDTEKGG